MYKNRLFLCKMLNNFEIVLFCTEIFTIIFDKFLQLTSPVSLPRRDRQFVRAVILKVGTDDLIDGLHQIRIILMDTEGRGIISGLAYIAENCNSHSLVVPCASQKKYFIFPR